MVRLVGGGNTVSLVESRQGRREEQLTQERAEAAITLSTEQGFAQRLAQGTMLRGWVLAMQGQGAAGLEQLRQYLQH